MKTRNNPCRKDADDIGANVMPSEIQRAPRNEDKTLAVHNLAINVPPGDRATLFPAQGHAMGPPGKMLPRSI
ncbi:hypothetical protein HYPDE_38813 [Hyphomicrobium denitrificans 1NES1]|uniref:Uncharacterized protein n=1 Tax=Hyphomicrobium denitrificans 1NES1 TaxID=670307 RepID=N0BB18_9HYPH|nr:hypothetical protein HYPDE_38813 [Hyphomicrobium denitrificans 1NES1]